VPRGEFREEMPVELGELDPLDPPANPADDVRVRVLDEIDPDDAGERERPGEDRGRSAACPRDRSARRTTSGSHLAVGPSPAI
jgi:hypothetical protein